MCVCGGGGAGGGVCGGGVEGSFLDRLVHVSSRSCYMKTHKR